MVSLVRETDGAERVARALEILGGARTVWACRRWLARSAHRSTASRLLGTLAASGMVERDQLTQRYRLGARIVGLAATAVSRLPVVTQARPSSSISAATSETVNLAILDRFHVVYVDQVTPHRPS